VGNTTVLYGYIDGVASTAELNAQRIATLPMDDEDPYLTPDLFSVPLQIHSYNDHLITFGTLYKNFGIAVQWPQWREKYEAMLRTLSWDRARVYLDAEDEGRYEYAWTGLRQDDDDDETFPQGLPAWRRSFGCQRSTGHLLAEG
jgi:hypothetical protein